MNIAINGFGRIGRAFLRVIIHKQQQSSPLRVVAINCGPGAHIDQVAYSVKYDTLMGTLDVPCYQEGDVLLVGDQKIKLFAVADPASCVWGDLNVDWVVDCSGKCTKENKARLHLQVGARKVLISAPAQTCDVTIIPGINDELYDPQNHNIVSLGSCTTNAFLPILKVLNQTFGISQGEMTTIHAYTNSQVLLDVDSKSPRKSRSACMNIIPTSTGASKVMGIVMPELEGKVHAMALRVPVAKGSLIDLTVKLEKTVDTQQLITSFTTAAESSLQGILGVTFDPIVSSDCWDADYSVLIDGSLCESRGTMAKVFGWYDNEWGYSCRLFDFLSHCCS